MEDVLEMQERQSPRDEPTLSQPDGKVVSPSSMKKEPEIVQGKLNSAIENPDSGVSKLLVQSNLGQNRDVEKPILHDCDTLITLMSESLAAGSGKASVLTEKLPLDDGTVHRPVIEEKLISENRNDGQLSQLPITPKKDLGEPSVIPNAEGCSSTPNVKKSPESEVQLSEFSKVSIITKADPDDLEHGHGSDARRNDSTEPRKSLVLFHSPVPTSSSDQDNISYSAMSEKTVYKLQPRRNPDSGVNVQIEQNNSSTRGHEKALDDGYNWRKYGQKLVKGNSFVKSYYKCTSSDCRAKKQVERCNDGRLTDIKYIGRHEHPKPHSSQVPTVVQPLQVFQADVPTQPTIMKEEPGVAKNAENSKIDHPIEPVQIPKEPVGMEYNNSVVTPLPELRKHRDHVDDNSSPNPKRLKSETTSVEDNQVKKSFCESRQVVQMMSAVDIVHDGYRWRKYGQKLVKGNPNPRSYYRCSTAGCTVKKHVERASHDPKLVVTTYEGNHDHDMPNPRTITQTVVEAEGGGNNVLATTNGEIKSELGEQNKAGRDMVLPIRIKLQNTGAN